MAAAGAAKPTDAAIATAPNKSFEIRMPNPVRTCL
jgi:hypothetical protein